MSGLELLRHDVAYLHWTEKMEVVNLAAMLLFIPVNSGISLVFACVWMFNVILKNTMLKRWSFFGWHQDKNYHYSKSYCFLIPMMCYWGAYLISMLWTENQPAGRLELGQLIWFLVLPLTCVCTDFRQFSERIVRMMLWIYVLTLSVLFVLNLAIQFVHACGAPEYSFFEYLATHEFYYMHHSYMALYLVAGMAFLYSEWARKEKHGKRELLVMIVCLCCLLLFLFFINSRTGSLCLILLLGLCLTHLFFVQKRYRTALVSLVVIIALVTGVHYALPDNFRRLSNTAGQVAQGDDSDIRFTIMNNAWTIVKDNVVLGVGAGDRMDVLTPFYITEENPHDTIYNPHNQYLDTWMATGVTGLLALLVMLLLPWAMAWKKRYVFPVLLLVMIMVSLLFESMLERQMGIVFTGVMYIYILLFFQLDSIGIITTKFPQHE